mgnify:CR=1 FL=1
MSSLPNPQDAYNQLFHNVHAEVFFGKLASYGIQATTEKEAADAEKQAAESSRFGGAVSALNNITTQPTTPAQRYQAQGQAIKQAASQLAQDPSIYNAVISLKAHEAAVLAGAE